METGKIERGCGCPLGAFCGHYSLDGRAANRRAIVVESIAHDQALAARLKDALALADALAAAVEGAHDANFEHDAPFRECAGIACAAARAYRQARGG